VVKVLDTPPPITFTNVTFPEGFTLSKFAAAARGEGAASLRRQVPHGANSGQLRSKYQPDGVNNLEGLLFPDTYQVASNDDEAKVIARLITQMEKVATAEGVDYARSGSTSPPTRCSRSLRSSRRRRRPTPTARRSRGSSTTASQGMNLEIARRSSTRWAATSIG
jgi:hypothetical protein